MKKGISCFFLFLVMVFVPCVLLAAESGVETVPVPGPIWSARCWDICPTPGTGG